MTAAFELAASGTVVLLEAERELAFHTTGRSAAAFLESYGGAPIRALTRASRPLLDACEDRFGTSPILSPRGLLWIASADQVATLDATVATMRSEGAGLVPLGPADAIARVPALDRAYLAAAALEPDAMEIDVMALHQGYLRGLVERRGEVVRSARVSALRRVGDAWEITAGERTVNAGVVVNAAGAWCDTVAALAGLPPAPIRPLRRTACICTSTWTGDASAWPIVLDADEEFYFKPEGPHFLVSPADETPSEPRDARPVELDVAIGIERVNRATTLGFAHVRTAWAGLRSFAPDRRPVIGYDPLGEGFVWLGGQGGYGIQMSAALAEVVASLVRGEGVPRRVAAEGLDLDAISISRLRT